MSRCFKLTDVYPPVEARVSVSAELLEQSQQSDGLHGKHCSNLRQLCVSLAQNCMFSPKTPAQLSQSATSGVMSEELRSVATPVFQSPMQAGTSQDRRGAVEVRKIFDRGTLDAQS